LVVAMASDGPLDCAASKHRSLQSQSTIQSVEAMGPTPSATSLRLQRVPAVPRRNLQPSGWYRK
jgi:hypothetical protein